VSRRPPLLSDALRRRWVLIAGVTAFCILAALAYGQVRHTSYEADTTVIVYPLAGTPFAQQSSGTQLFNDLSTEAQLVRSDPVSRLAQQQLTSMGYDKLTLGGLISRVTATVETNAQVLRLAYQAGAPRRARDGADAFAAAYLKYREALAGATTTDGLSQIAVSRARTEQARTLTAHALANVTPGSAQAGQYRAQILLDDKTLVDLRTQEADLQKRPVLPGEVLSPATLPASPHGTSPPILGGIGLLAGLLFGTVIAVGRERMVGTVRRAASLPDEPPLLATVPPARVREPVLLSDPTHRSGEEYRLLYLAVDAALPVSSDRGNIIAVSSLTHTGSPVAVNLALAAAASGRVTTYVDALPRRSAPRLPALSVSTDAAGFADAVTTGLDPVAGRMHVAPGLTVLPSGGNIDRAAESYGGPRTHRVFESLRRASDLIVVAIPPLTDPDGQALANLADAVVVVVPIGKATFGQLNAALAETSRVHAHILGLVAAHPASGPPAARNQSPRKADTTSAGDEQPQAPATWVPT
jgi:Mrp family chromosome partitioning ATPase/capsular polysaccharide biosynthesis protein